jgi:multidrug resistance efflux pump
MFEIVNVSKLKLKVSINENQVAGLKSGNTVAVSVYPDTKFAGKITFIAQWQIQA